MGRFACTGCTSICFSFFIGVLLKGIGRFNISLIMGAVAIVSIWTGERIVGGPQLNLMLIKSDLVLCINQAAILI